MQRKASPVVHRRRPVSRVPKPEPARVLAEATPRAVVSPDAVLLRLADGSEITLPADPDPRWLQRDAMYWSYVVRSRRRWAGGADITSVSPVQRLLTADQLERIAGSGLVEVDIPFHGEEVGWEYRILPWEHLLSQATESYRGERHLAVVRRLRLEAPPPAAARGSLVRPMIVESAPAGLDKFYDVAGEGELMLSGLGLAADGVAIVLNPDLRTLQAEIAKTNPSLIHLAGVDTHQAMELLQIREGDNPDATRLDGYALRGPDPKSPVFIDALALSHVLTSGATKPDVVVCNFYNSAARTAALAVAAGARSAIGYQDVIEDVLAGAFCTTFYRSLRAGETVPESFQRALAMLQGGSEKLKGACVVLWSSESVIAPPRAAKAGRARPAEARLPSRKLRPATEVPASDRIRVEVKPHESINYSLLHNRRSLFRAFDIYRRDATGPIDNIEVAVTLYVGQEPFPFRLNLSMKGSEDYLTIADRVVVPLTSSIIRTQTESVQSSLFVEVKCDGATVFADTSRVELSPVDEWTDTDENRWWLPSFVLPRDPSVAEIVDRAQRYLMAMADDPTAGFDGYQSVDPAAATFEGRYGPVDLQVRAIWSALQYDFNLHYINPPPSYAASRQRLRTPTDVVQGRRGTCIDLALLVAACLEYIDVYPVVFLLTGHAFPGYWRSDAFHDDFTRIATVPLPETATPDALNASQRTTVHFEDAYALKNFLETRDLVANGKVVPLETVWLTTNGPFADAVEEGRKNLRRAREFDSMIDIVQGRSTGVKPLPILGRPE